MTGPVATAFKVSSVIGNPRTETAQRDNTRTETRDFFVCFFFWGGGGFSDDCMQILVSKLCNRA